MPYSIEQKAPEQWCVYDNDTKEEVGEYTNRTAAMKKMRELVRKEDAGEKEEPKKKKAEEEDEDDE